MADVPDAPHKLEYRPANARRRTDWPLVVFKVGTAVVVAGAAVVVLFYLFVWYTMKMP